MTNILQEGKLKFKDLLIFGTVIICIAGTILFYDSENADTFIHGNNVVWVNFHDNYMELWTRSNIDIYGVQFEFDGINIISKGSGYLIDNNFEASHNDRMILAFSFKGEAVPNGEHMLLSLNLSYLNGKHNATMKNTVIAGKAGKALDYGYYDVSLRRETLRSF